jgi:hypothetical protein
MKENNYIRIRIYLLIIFIAFTVGWIVTKPGEHYEINGRVEYEERFNYALFGFCCSVGLAITIIGDVVIHLINRNNDRY